MPFNLSLKWLITVIFLLMVGLLVAGYTELSGRYFILGMDNMISSNMEYFARDYLSEDESGLHDTHGFIVTDDWALLPEEVKQAFPLAPGDSGQLYKQVEPSDVDGAPPKKIHFIMRYTDQHRTVFVSRNVSRDMISDMVHNNVVSSRNTLFIIGVVTALVFLVIVLLVLWRVSRPLSALTQWTRTLSAEKLAQPVPDFVYPELNEMAGLIQESLSSVQQGLEREQRFLRHTSHELRTPISVIRNNIELLQHLQNSGRDIDPVKQQSIIDRIDRSSLTMQYLTETLLWLSKESPEALKVAPLSLDKLVEELVTDMRYLLNDKPVNVAVEVQACTLELPEIAVRIILGNLIRNAFQHSWEGEVEIIQQNNRVTIRNEQTPVHTSQDTQGFGLGLQLTEQLSNKLGWKYKLEQSETIHGVSVEFR